MNWISKLERKFGRYAIQNLMFYVIALYTVGFALSLVAPEFYYQYLSLNIEAVFHGQIWRLVTFLMQPPNSSALFMVFALYLYYMIGRQLEYAWGAFRFNLYFFTGALFHILAAILVYVIAGVSFPFGIVYKANALAAVVSILNFLIFYVSTRNMKRYSPKEVRRKKAYKKAVYEAKREQHYEGGAKHKCAVCGRTELDDENLEFRYCSKCNGNYEYCQDHLFTHEHVK